MKAIASLLLVLIALPSYGEFKNESEVSVVLTGGNSELETYNAKTLSTYTLNKRNDFKLGGHYTLGTSFGVESARNWDINYRYDRKLHEKWSAFWGGKIEGDEFAGIRTRINNDLGARYNVLKSKKSELFAEAGYRYTVERRTLGLATLQFSKARLYTEGKKQINDNVRAKLWVEYLPNFTEGSDWNINIEPSLSVVLSETFSLKLAYQGLYDNLPVPGARKYDYSYTTGLLANF